MHIGLSTDYHKICCCDVDSPYSYLTLLTLFTLSCSSSILFTIIAVLSAYLRFLIDIPFYFDMLFVLLCISSTYVFNSIVDKIQPCLTPLFFTFVLYTDRWQAVGLPYVLCYVLKSYIVKGLHQQLHAKKCFSCS